jgi:hypothetical protein
MAKFYIADEVNDSNTADILASGAVEVAPVYTYAKLPSAEAYTVLYAAPVYLHSVTVANTCTATGYLGIYDIGGAATATGVGANASSSAVAFIDTSSRNTYIFDAYIAGTLAYRLTGGNNNGLTITYQIA